MDVFAQKHLSAWLGEPKAAKACKRAILALLRSEADSVGRCCPPTSTCLSASSRSGRLSFNDLSRHCDASTQAGAVSRSRHSRAAMSVPDASECSVNLRGPSHLVMRCLCYAPRTACIPKACHTSSHPWKAPDLDLTGVHPGLGGPFILFTLFTEASSIQWQASSTCRLETKRRRDSARRSPVMSWERELRQSTKMAAPPSVQSSRRCRDPSLESHRVFRMSE